MTVQIKITNGTYRNQPVEGLFELAKEWKLGVNGGFVTVVNDGSIEGAGDKARVKVAQDDFEMFGELAGEYHAPKGKDKVVEEFEETDEEIINRFEKTFSFVDTMTAAAQDGKILGLVISGPAGIGKSYGVEKTLEKKNMMRVIRQEPEHYELVTGGTSAPGLYKKLYENKKAGQVLVFDDCDSVFSDELSLNILKAALDSKANRTIHWNTDSHKLRNEGVPDQFTFKGSAIFITNLKLDKARGKLKEHLAALESRCHYVDLTIDTDREKMLRIEQITKDGMLDDYRLGKEVDEAIVDFVRTNKDRVRELSL